MKHLIELVGGYQDGLVVEFAIEAERIIDGTTREVHLDRDRPYMSGIWGRIRSGRNGAGNTIPTLTRSLDRSKERLAMNATPRPACRMPECTKPSDRIAAQLCQAHYWQVRWNGHPEITLPPNSLASIDDLIKKNGVWNAGCYLYAPNGILDDGNYGRVQGMGLHRYVAAARYGAIPPGQVVRHACDRRRCVNPDHLLLGTQKDNMQDRAQRGGFVNAPRGSRSHKAKLHEGDIRVIRKRLAAKEHPKAVAAAYGVTPTTIRYIRDGRAWAHVPDAEREGERAREVAVADRHKMRPRGSAHPGSKLTEELVKEIRSSRGTATHRELGAKFGVSERTIRKVLSGGSWVHV